MSSRLRLHDELLTFYPNVYFQPPANITMKYPCIVYNKEDKDNKFSNNSIYGSKQGYQLTVIEHDPDSVVSEEIEKHFDYCVINNYFSSDNLNHTNLKLYY